MPGSLRTSTTAWLALFASAGALLGALAATFLADDLTWLAIALASVALVAALAAAWVAHRLLAPLDRLASSATTAAAEKRPGRVPVDGARETRLVAEAFNQMATEVENALEEVRAEQRRESQFVSDVSHELRTPLTAIRGAAETLLDGDVDAEDQQRFLSTIAVESGRLARLADDLLALQRIEGATGELPLRRVDLRVAADRAAAMLEPLVEDRGVALVVEGSAPVVLGDADRLQQVVANLVDNASRIVGGNGHVTVSLGREPGGAVLSVLDDGPGIPPEDLPRLFDRFYRSQATRERSSGGTGLGLSIVRAIVVAHGGTIEAENRPEGGSLFTVRLPALAD
jgi:two-component system OmpR family sensor kinase